MRVHLDTDLGTSMDDLAALVMLLGSAEVELTGITTCIDPGGRRAGYAGYVLGLAGRVDVPLEAGAEVSLTTLEVPGDFPPVARRWPEPVPPAPSPAGSALRLLAESIDAGATIVAIGPCTNLALLAVDRPDLLAGAEVVMMGGWFDPVAGGLPQWAPAQDWNVQCDTAAAALVVGSAGRVTLVPLSLTVRAHLRARHLERLHRTGPLGRLIALQAENQAAERSTAELARSHSGLPDDLLAFQHDALACAAAIGWPGVNIEERRLAPALDGEILRFAEADEGRTVGVAAEVDAEAFEELWLASLERAKGDHHPS